MVGAHLYRGTTRGWPGSSALRQLAITPTTDDPLVATLFAIEAGRFGTAIVQLCRRENVTGLVGQANLLSDLEREVALRILPVEFTNKHVVTAIPALTAREFLADLGYELPATITGKRELQHYLSETPRVRETDKREFDRRAVEGTGP